jgi:hypothetical protein
MRTIRHPVTAKPKVPITGTGAADDEGTYPIPITLYVLPPEVKDVIEPPDVGYRKVAFPTPETSDTSVETPGAP